MSNQQSHAIVFIDIVGSTQLYESIGDLAAKQLITDLQEGITQVVQEAGGSLVEVVGDEVMCRYNDANLAVSAACRIQEWVDRYPTMNGRDMQVRIGLHYGPVIIEDGKIFGNSVNIAARVVSIAQARQIITTEEVVNCLSDNLNALARRFDVVKVKGKQEAIVIYDVLWDRTNVTDLYQAAPSLTTRFSDLYLHAANNKYVIPKTQSNYRIGRNQDNDLVLIADPISRSHARIEYVHGKFVLIDTSTNGTFVLTEEKKSIYLLREELPLLRGGKIGLGEPVSSTNKHVISYEVH